MDRADRADGLSVFNKVLLSIALIGAVNWGLIGFFNWNLVDAIFGGGAAEQTSALSRLIYSIVGLCALALALTFPWGRRISNEALSRTAGRRRVEVGP